jgi:hypothetical protein
MEKPQKPTRNHEQERPKTLEDYVVATFHADADPDITTSPLTVIRSGQDGKGVRYDGGWIPGDMLSVCDTDSEKGISPIELFVKVHKPINVNGEYVPATKIVSLKKLQSREANKGFDEYYIQDLYGKSTEEMLKEGTEAAEQIWRQKHPASDWNSLSTAETGLDESDSPELDRFDERVRELTEPLETDVDGMPFEDEPVRENYFDHLYDPNYEPPNDVEAAAVRNPKGVPISENSLNAAKEAINSLATNPFLMQIINPEGALDSEVDSKEIMNNIRSSYLTRCRLFEYLTSRLNNLAVDNPRALEDRVRSNSEGNLKTPNHLGGDYYKDRMRSREYAVVLAIAMIDGSFDVDRQDKIITHYRDGKGRCGMHRDSARVLLEYVSKRDNY